MSNSNQIKKLSYYNTLIFTIISGIISVLLLLVLLLKTGRKYLPFIITLELGIFGIILMCVIQIVVNENNLAKFKNSLSKVIAFNECPDYFTKRSISDGTEICSNEYIYTGKDKTKYIMKLYPLDDTKDILTGSRPFPSKHTYDYTTSSRKYDKFPLMEIQNDTSLKTASEKCSVLFTEPSDSTLKTNYKDYNLIPWLTMKSKCDTI